MIEVRHLKKSFGKQTVLRDLSFTIRAGEAVALWGANGAGKTTILRCLLGLLTFEGKLSIAGHEVTRDGRTVRHKVGFVPQELALYGDMSVQESLTFFAHLKKTPLPSNHIARFGLIKHRDKNVGALSGGLKQRLALATALLTEPPALFLDEPTANLDTRARDDIAELLQELKADGKTLLFTSHRLEEVFDLADRILVLEQGKLKADCPPQELGKVLGLRHMLWLSVPPETLPQALTTLDQHGFGASRQGHRLRVPVELHAKAQPINLLVEAGIPVQDFEVGYPHQQGHPHA